MRFITHRTRRPARRLTLVCGLLILVLAISACTFEVQPIEQYTSQDGYLSVSHPVTWDVLEDGAEDDATTVFVGTNEEVMDMQAIAPGEAGVGIILGPEFLFAREFGSASTINAEELADVMRVSFLEGVEEAEASQVSQVGPIDMALDAEVYGFSVAMPEVNMTLYTFAPAEETLVLVLQLTSPEDADSFRLAEAEAVVNSIRLVGDPEELAERAFR